jgi:aminoglycoside N3'-acetyltransferase
MKTLLNKKDLIEQLNNAGVSKGDLLHIKVSYKSIGSIDGGPLTLVESLLEVIGEEGTIVSDAFINGFPLPLSKQNAKILSDSSIPSYAGAITNVMLKYPGSLRSPHPLQKFVAIGKNADIVLNHNENSRPYSVLHEMAKLGGKNLKIGSNEQVPGVGTVHVAIDLLELKQKVLRTGINYRDANGNIKLFEKNWPTGCRNIHIQFLPLYAQKNGAILKVSKLGNAETTLTDMKKTLEIELELGKRDLNYFLCSDPACYRCQLNWSHSKGSFLKVIIENLKRKKYKRILAIFILAFSNNFVPKN